MRHLVFAAVLFAPLLAACDAPAARMETAAAEPAQTTEQVEARRACGELTGHRGDAEPTSAEDQRRAQEYAACVDAVLKVDQPPALRGRTDAPV